MTEPKISLIAAIGKNRELGYKNQLLWKIPDDLKRFKALTLGHTVVMGRKTFESIGRPLPNRTNIIITRDQSFSAPGCTIVHSLNGAIGVGADIIRSTEERRIASAPTEAEIFIIGGEQIYEQALPLADKLYLTIIDAESQADAFFPNYDAFSKIISREEKEWQGLKYSFVDAVKSE